MSESKPSKGCYNCMKRRIKCDRTEPHCLKCRKKGLECPGFSVRYRFNDGVASRGHLKGKNTPNEQNEGEKIFETVPLQTGELKWIEERRPASYNREGVDRGMQDEVSQVESGESSRAALSRFIGVRDKEPGILDSIQWNNIYIDTSPTMLNPVEFLDAKTRFLFSHFSTHVSPIMILFDGEKNGYRHQILPFGVYNDLVQRAICVAAALHLAPKMPELRRPAEEGRAAIIRKLKDNADMNGESGVFTVATWVAILLLIVADLVTGNEDVLILYHMLQSYLKGRVPSMETPLTNFLMYQSRLIDFFAHPVLGENNGVETLSKITQPLINIGEWDSSAESSSGVMILLFNEAFRQARDIYLLRAQANSCFIDESHETKMRQLIQQLKLLLIELDPTTEGAHTLVWPYFIAAAESRDECDRQFFYKRLEHIWTTSGYENVKVALVELERIWRRQRLQRWTSIVPRIATIIM